ncbi:hypothetical protein BJ165DRAFT_759999 [Panaeolus papilionaceus]|nr:hypothetical protein BJ165DRAFT_759999 [Panaeolus papilionaceus]
MRIYALYGREMKDIPTRTSPISSLLSSTSHSMPIYPTTMLIPPSFAYSPLLKFRPRLRPMLPSSFLYPHLPPNVVLSHSNLGLVVEEHISCSVCQRCGFARLRSVVFLVIIPPCSDLCCGRELPLTLLLPLSLPTITPLSRSIHLYSTTTLAPTPFTLFPPKLDSIGDLPSCPCNQSPVSSKYMNLDNPIINVLADKSDL